MYKTRYRNVDIVVRYVNSLKVYIFGEIDILFTYIWE